MITFLAPAALFAASLLAIPLILHLFKPRKVRQTPFSSLRWLHLSQQKLARRIKWHQVLLFLLRAAFLLLMVLALARPTYSRGGESGVAERFIILDVSRSMAYQAIGRPTPMELGKQVAESLVTGGVADDRTTAFLTASSTRPLGPLTRDPDIYLPALHAAQATMADTDLTSALQVIRPMLAHRRPGSRVELYFITDNHQRVWRQSTIAGFLKDLNIPIQAELIDVGVIGAQNAWIANARFIETSKPARRMVRVEVGCIGDSQQHRVVRIAGLAGLPELTQNVTIEPGSTARAEIELPATYDTAGKVAHITIGPSDALPSDDEFFLNLDARDGTKVLLIESDSTQIESLRPGFYLRTALGALASAESRAINPVVKTSATVVPTDFTNADAVILAAVPDLSDANLAALENRVKSGGGLAIFLGPDIQPSFYNTRLYNPLSPSESLMPAALKSITPVSRGLAPMTNIHWSHPMLAPLFDPILGDLAQTQFRTYYQLDSLAPSTETLASIGESAPAIMERPVGAGKVILFNTTANDAWSDLPRRKSFVPLIDHLIAKLSGGGVRRSYEVGDTVTLPLAGMKHGGAVTVLIPNGKRITPVVQSEAGRPVMRMEGVQDPGVYRVEWASGSGGSGGSGSENFVVQVGREDSVLTPTDTAMLKKWWEPTDLKIIGSDAALKGRLSTSERVALWPWLIALACLALATEMFFVHWLCPRMNPGIATSVVSHGGRVVDIKHTPTKVPV